MVAGAIKSSRWLGAQKAVYRSAFADEYIGAIDSLLASTESALELEAIEPSAGYRIDYRQLESLYAHHHCLEPVGRLVAIECFLEESRRCLDLQTKNGAQRYADLLREAPDILRSVPPKDVELLRRQPGSA